MSDDTSEKKFDQVEKILISAFSLAAAHILVSILAGIYSKQTSISILWFLVSLVVCIVILGLVAYVYRIYRKGQIVPEVPEDNEDPLIQSEKKIGNALVSAFSLAAAHVFVSGIGAATSNQDGIKAVWVFSGAVCLIILGLVVSVYNQIECEDAPVAPNPNEPVDTNTVDTTVAPGGIARYTVRRR